MGQVGKQKRLERQVKKRKFTGESRAVRPRGSIYMMNQVKLHLYLVGLAQQVNS